MHFTTYFLFMIFIDIKNVQVYSFLLLIIKKTILHIKKLKKEHILEPKTVVNICSAPIAWMRTRRFFTTIFIMNLNKLFPIGHKEIIVLNGIIYSRCNDPKCNRLKLLLVIGRWKSNRLSIT